MDAMSIAAVAMRDDSERVKVISHNLANVATPGYKRQIAAGSDFSTLLQTGAIQGADVQARAQTPLASLADPANLSASVNPANLANAVHALDMRAGTLRSTGNPLDLALEGDGFFEIHGKEGSVWARQASLRIDPHGNVLTSQGQILSGVYGLALANGGPLQINADGEIRQGERVLGQLRLQRFEDSGRMQALGGGLFAQGEAKLAANKEAPPLVRSGHLENANVNAAQEMVALSETVRHFEALQKAVQSYGEVYEQTLRKLGEF